MAVQRQVGAFTDAKPSATNLKGKDGRFAKRVAGGLDVCGLGEQPAGVISEGKEVGLHTSINTGNQLKVLAGANIAIDDKISSDADGRAKVSAAGDYVYGNAISAAAAGEFVEFEVTNEGVLAA